MTNFLWKIALVWLALDVLSLLGLAALLWYDKKQFPDVRARLRVLR